ncbi:MAG: hypothetical protein CMN30_13575 [Sandaracinus sp.]|nr:hypothetical protein [Sandaracinus sp.]
MDALPALTPQQLAAAEEHLLGPGGDALARFMFARAVHEPSRDRESEAVARALGWLDGDGFSDLGNLVKDPLRELVFWERRDRKLHSQDTSPALRPPSFAGRAVLEVGCGGGCNLLTLATAEPPPARVVGVEPMPVYRQMAPILARMVGLAAPETVAGWGSALPFAAGAFDIALCYSAHQYMDVDRAIAEMGRVLRPGGRLLVIGNTLIPFAAESVERFVHARRLGTLKYDVVALANTLAYQLTGRRALRDRGGTTTATPIYPSRPHVHRAMRAADLVPIPHEERLLPTRETLFIATKK